MPRDFTFQEDSPETPRDLGHTQEGRRTVPREHKSQSERDWAFAVRSTLPNLARGVANRTKSASWGKFSQTTFSFICCCLPHFCRRFLQFALHFRDSRHLSIGRAVKQVPTRTPMCERIKSFQEMACFLVGERERPCRTDYVAPPSDRTASNLDLPRHPRSFEFFDHSVLQKHTTAKRLVQVAALSQNSLLCGVDDKPGPGGLLRWEIPCFLNIC